MKNINKKNKGGREAKKKKGVEGFTVRYGAECESCGRKFESICRQPTIRFSLRTFFGLNTQSSPGSVQVRLASIYFFLPFPPFLSSISHSIP